MRAVVLEQVKRYAAIFIDGDDFAVEQSVRGHPFTRSGDTRKLSVKEIAQTRPESNSAFVSACQAAITVKLYFIKPFLAFGDVLDGEGIHWLDEMDDVSSSCVH